MTTKFSSVEDALQMGAHYACVDKTAFDGVTPEKTELGWPQNTTIDVYYIKNNDGKEVGIGVGKFRDGFDLWLIATEIGFCQRV